MNMHVRMVFVVNCLLQSLGQAEIISVSNSSKTWHRARNDCEEKGESLFLLPLMNWTAETIHALFQLLPRGEMFWTRDVASYGPMVALYGCVTVHRSKFVTVQDLGDRNSIGICLATCPHKLFGLIGSTCYCVQNSTTVSLNLDTDNCDKRCPGNSNDVCGNPNVTALFRTMKNDKKVRPNSNGSCLLYVNDGTETLFEWADCNSQFDGYICEDRRNKPMKYKGRVPWYGALRKCLEKKYKSVSLPGITAYLNLGNGKYWTGIRRSTIPMRLYNERTEPQPSRCLTVSRDADRLEIKDEDCSALHRYLYLKNKASGDTAQDNLWIYVGSGIALVIITCASVVFVYHRKYCRQKRPRPASFDNLAYNVMTPIHGQRPRSPHQQEPSAVYATIDDLDNTRV